MKFESFLYSVSVGLTLTRQDLNAMMRMATSHYDYKCKATVKVGGILYGWRKYFVDNTTSEISVTADSGELDLLVKVCENHSLDGSPDDEMDQRVYLKLKELLIKVSAEWERLNRK